MTIALIKKELQNLSNPQKAQIHDGFYIAK
jgi:hypothetical protein